MIRATIRPCWLCTAPPPWLDDPPLPPGRPCGRRARSGSYLDRSPVRDGAPYLLDLGIRHRDASIGPVGCMVRRSDPAQAVGKTVDHDAPAGRLAALPGPRAVIPVRVRDVQGAMIRAVGLAPVNRIHSFRSSFVALGPFRPDRIPAQRHAIRFQRGAAPIEREAVRLLL